MKRLTVLLLLPAALAQDRDRSRTFTDAVCTATITGTPATTTPMPALSVVDGDCPQSAALSVHYHNEDDVACCTQAATLAELAGGVACCPCGSVCTGDAPAMVAWSFSNNEFVTATDAEAPTTTDGDGSATTGDDESPTETESGEETGTETSTPTQSGEDSAGTDEPAAGSQREVSYAVMGLVVAGAFAAVL